jgi:hypothetical protein
VNRKSHSDLLEDETKFHFLMYLCKDHIDKDSLMDRVNQP